MGIKACSSRLDRSPYFQIRRMRPKDELRSISSNVYLEKHTDVAFDGVVEYVAKIEDKANKTTPVQIECAYQVHFHAPKGFRRQEAEEFVRSYLTIITWPYFREFVSDMSGKMAIAALTLPLLPDVARMAANKAETRPGLNRKE
ncbi:MAG TPA: hypothetical protein VJN93_17735 [Candidatus Acidoferrum sp.]|nr:hypothetical protein [Candidatus Acidoferrum sp.]